MKIDVLGAEYTLTVIRGSKEPRLKDCDGFCDETTKEMLVENYEDSKGGTKLQAKPSGSDK